MQSSKKKLLDPKYDKDDINDITGGIYKKNLGTTDVNEQIYNFINMCVSYYYGDKKWFEDDTNNTIISNIYKDKDTIIVKDNANTDIVTFSINVIPK